MCRATHIGIHLPFQGVTAAKARTHSIYQELCGLSQCVPFVSVSLGWQSSMQSIMFLILSFCDNGVREKHIVQELKKFSQKACRKKPSEQITYSRE